MLAIGCDHAGFSLKEALLVYLNERNIAYRDLGCFDTNSVDYPDIAAAVAQEILSGRCDRGLLVCGTGIGMSMTANRYKGIRCALCSDTYSARMTREHNDANVLAIGARVIGAGLAQEILDVFLRTDFAGDRHQARVHKIDGVVE